MPKSLTIPNKYVPSFDDLLTLMLVRSIGAKSGFQLPGFGGTDTVTVDTVTQLSLMTAWASALPKSVGAPVVAVLKTALAKAATRLG